MVILEIKLQKKMYNKHQFYKELSNLFEILNTIIIFAIAITFTIIVIIDTLFFDLNLFTLIGAFLSLLFFIGNSHYSRLLNDVKKKQKKKHIIIYHYIFNMPTLFAYHY
jgi:FlaA1/EpsC-like NDP-sugar epimerase